MLHARVREPQSSQQSRGRNALKKKDIRSNGEGNFKAEQIRQRYNIKQIVYKVSGEERERDCYTDSQNTYWRVEHLRTEEEDLIPVSRPTNWLHEQPKWPPSLAPNHFWSLAKGEELSPSSMGHLDASHPLTTYTNPACTYLQFEVVFLAPHKCGLILA